ncbi:MAG: ABC transporter ATP-binding protein [Spirochaetales bacterium]|nr:ABC transporter ATP-binding protein [Spirochaetales bacterium]
MILRIKDLVTRFYTANGTVKAVNGISYSVDKSEIVGVVGESGSGKSVSMRSVMRILPEPPAKIEKGEIFFKGNDLLKLEEREIQSIRGKDIAMVFQDPMTSLNPVLTIGRQLTEVLIEHEKMNKNQAKERAIELLNWVGIPNPKLRINEYPHEFSGGMRQRAMIAMAIACNPSLLIADEPTTALDVTVQLQITELVKRLQRETGMAVIWITHDLGVIARIASRVMVMYAGYIVETASVKELYANPMHPYTIGLLRSLPRIDEKRDTRLISIPGQPPDLVSLPKGCPLADRCTYKTERCLEETPVLTEINKGHSVACWEKEKVIADKL